MAGASFRQRAAEALDEASAAATRWHEGWQADTGQGYSDADQALLDMDEVLQSLQDASARWDALSPPADFAERYAQVSEALRDLIARLEELEGALEARDVERLRVLSQAAELSVQRVRELREDLRAD